MKRAGHQEIHGENIAQFEFSQAGWNPFRHSVDEDQVDLLLRRRQEGRKPEYREIQVKWSRTWGAGDLSAWKRPHFTHESWRIFAENEFRSHRPELFVSFVIPRPDGAYTGDIFIFPSEQFNALIKSAPLHKQGEKQRCFTLACTHHFQWYLLLQRTKFKDICDTAVREVTIYRRNFSILETAV